jgi:protein-S-isoprenylcysteine O-methyltransferase Ste14
VVFLAPAIALLVNSWLGLTAPVFMYFVLRSLVHKEEIYLENTFGAEYQDYKTKVPCILPYGWLKANT